MIECISSDSYLLIDPNMKVRTHSVPSSLCLHQVLSKPFSWLQVTDMMLQDKPYPDWGKSARAFWKKGNVRIILFW